MAEGARALAVHERLLEFYGQPDWPTPQGPIEELVSTILSQNTNDINRDKAFAALTARYPNWEAVRDADPEEVVDTIRVAGLANQKGPRIQAVLRDISEQRGELSLDFLRELDREEAREWLQSFKGVGPKTAAIVLQYGLGVPAFAVDTHIHRITGRIGLRSPKLTADKTHDLLEALLPPETWYAAHLNIIRLGREVCQARVPKCPDCPLQDLCDYYAEVYQGE